MSKGIHLAVVGATGVVGQKMRQVLEERDFPIASIKFLAGSSKGNRTLTFKGKEYPVEALSPEAFEGVQIVLSSTPGGVSKEWSPIAAKAGAIVVDNSSAFRMDAEVPLVVPEVNPGALAHIPKGIVANPNCSTIQMLVALKPLHDLAGIKRLVVCTYQASSGKGSAALEDLQNQMAAIGRGEEVPASKSHRDILGGSVLAHDWTEADGGFQDEEWKMVKETRKILGDDSIQVSPTAVRVPVMSGHSEALHVEFHRPITVEQAHAALERFPNVILSKTHETTPTPLQAADRDEVFVGRVRKDPSVENGLVLWVVSDNLRKGAATNAIQIAETLIKNW